MIIGMGDDGSLSDSLSSFIYTNSDGSSTLVDQVLDFISGAKNSVQNAVADDIGGLFPKYADSNANRFLSPILTAGPSVPSDASLATGDPTVIFGDISAGTQQNYVNAANQGFANAAAAQGANAHSSLNNWLLIGCAVAAGYLIFKR